MADTKTKTAEGTLQMEVVPPTDNKKVELDLDDAPFLQKEEEPRKEPPPRRLRLPPMPRSRRSSLCLPRPRRLRPRKV